MEYGICPLSIVPVRSEPNDRAEQVTQLLFGETLEVLHSKQQWRHIRIRHDGYEGWIDEKQYLHLSKKELDAAEAKAAFSVEVAHSVTNDTHHIPIVLGSTLPQFDGINCSLGKHKYWFSGQAYDPAVHNHKPQVLEKLVHKFHYAPYLWGGRTPFGVDCSGLTQTVYRVLGVPLKRDAYQQAQQGQEIGFLDAAQPGDLAFFTNKEGRIAHVGILLPQGQIIHAYGRVRIDKLDHHGIYNAAQDKYTHKLRLLRRVL